MFFLAAGIGIGQADFLPYLLALETCAGVCGDGSSFVGFQGATGWWGREGIFVYLPIFRALLVFAKERKK